MSSSSSRATAWTRANLETQGYRLSEREAAALAVGLRFSTGLCLSLVVTALVMQSAPMLVALSAIGLVAGTTPRHPFDLLWNHGVRHVLRAPALPRNPRRRRHAFKLATVWLFAVAGLFAAGADAAALALGVLLVGACALVTTTNYCIPSTLLEAWESRSRTGVAA